MYLNKNTGNCLWTLYLYFTFWVGKVNSSRSNLRNFTSIQLCVSIVIYRFRGTKKHDGSLEYQELNALLFFIESSCYNMRQQSMIFPSCLKVHSHQTRAEAIFVVYSLIINAYSYSLSFLISPGVNGPGRKGIPTRVTLENRSQAHSQASPLTCIVRCLTLPLTLGVGKA